MTRTVAARRWRRVWGSREGEVGGWWSGCRKGRSGLGVLRGFQEVDWGRPRVLGSSLGRSSVEGLGLVSFVIERASLYSGKSSSRIVFGFSFARSVLGGMNRVVAMGSGAGESTRLASLKALPSSLSSAPIPSPAATPSFLRNFGGGRRESLCAPPRTLPPSLCTPLSSCAALPNEPSPFCDSSTRRMCGGFDWPSVL